MFGVEKPTTVPHHRLNGAALLFVVMSVHGRVGEAGDGERLQRLLARCGHFDKQTGYFPITLGKGTAGDARIVKKTFL